MELFHCKVTVSFFSICFNVSWIFFQSCFETLFGSSPFHQFDIYCSTVTIVFCYFWASLNSFFILLQSLREFALFEKRVSSLTCLLCKLWVDIIFGIFLFFLFLHNFKLIFDFLNTILKQTFLIGSNRFLKSIFFG